MDTIRLISSELHKTYPSQGQVENAEFFVHIQGSAELPVLVYSFTAMTLNAYRSWFWEQHVRAGETMTEEDVSPVPIPEEMLLSGLVEYVQRRYLDPAMPEEITRLRPFFVGPLNVAEG